MSVSSELLKQCRDRHIALIRGKVLYSHVRSQYTGADLQRQIQREVEKTHTKYPTTVPYTALSISGPQVLFRDYNNPTPEEVYARDVICYVKNNVGYANFKSTGRSLPPIYKRDAADPRHLIELENEEITGELAKGLDITVIVGFFRSSTGSIGRGLNGIILEEPFRSYAPVHDLNEYGMTITPSKSGPTPVEEGNRRYAESQAAHQAAQPAGSQPAAGWNPPPMPAPGTNGYAQSAPAPAPAPSAPAQPAGQYAPVNGAWSGQPAPASAQPDHAGSQAYSPMPAPAPAAAPAPQAAQSMPPSGGYMNPPEAPAAGWYPTAPAAGSAPAAAPENRNTGIRYDVNQDPYGA